MHEHRFRETDCFAREPLEASAQGELFALDLLRLHFADGVGGGGEVTVVYPRRVGVKVDEPKGLE